MESITVYCQCAGPHAPLNYTASWDHHWCPCKPARHLRLGVSMWRQRPRNLEALHFAVSSASPHGTYRFVLMPELLAIRCHWSHPLHSTFSHCQLSLSHMIWSLFSFFFTGMAGALPFHLREGKTVQRAVKATGNATKKTPAANFSFPEMQTASWQKNYKTTPTPP